MNPLKFLLLWAGVVTVVVLTAVTAQRSSAQLPMTAFAPTPVVTASFVGMGDTISGAAGHWGSVAYSAAKRGQNMYRICDANTGGATCKDIASDATTGIVSSTQNVGSIGTCGTGGNTCWVTKAYDDSGATACSGSTACDLVEASSVLKVAFVPNASGSIPGIACDYNNGNRLIQNGSASTPLTFLTSFSFTGSPGGYKLVVGDYSGSIQVYVDPSEVPMMFANNVLAAGSALSAGTFYSLIGTLDTGTSTGTIGVNGTSSDGTAGTNTSITGPGLCGATGSAGAATIIEGAFYKSHFTHTDITNMTVPMRANGGY